MSTRLSHSLYRLILFFTLALTVALPTTALAAPAKQPTDTADAVLIAYYESDVVAVEDAEVTLSLYFYEDATFEMSADAVDGEESSLAYGDYEETDNGVLLTLLGADEEDFDESIALELTYDADDSLVITGSPDGLFGEEDIILYPMDVEAATAEDDGAEDDGAEDEADTSADDDFAVAIGGAYVSPVQESEDSAGVVYLLNLLDDGQASLNSDYLNLEAPIFEIGTWTDNGDDTVTVEIVGTVDEEYEDAILLEFEVGEYGELLIEGISLYPLGILSYLEDDATDDSGEEIGSSESEASIFVAEVVFPDADEAVYVYMFVYDDGTVIMTDEEQTSSLSGEWTFEEEVLYVSITSDDESELDEPVEFTFEFDEDGSLLATEYPVEVFGEDDLIFVPVEDDGEDEAVTEGEFYYYESDVLPNSQTDGIVISLVLSADGAAMVSTDWMNDEDPTLEYGEWIRDDEGLVIVTVNEGPDGPYEEPFTFTFEENPDDFSLNLVEESVEAFGDAGLVLNRIE